MDINIYVNQKKINPLCSSAIAEYVKRLSPYCNMKIVCAPGHVKYTPGHNSAHYAVIQASQKVVSYGYGACRACAGRIGDGLIFLISVIPVSISV